jgi:N utilization substance protein B
MVNVNTKVNPRARRQARRALVQAIYQWQMTGLDTRGLEKQFEEEGTLDKADRPFFEEALRQVTLNTNDYDELVEPLLDRALKDLDKVELAILRLGTFELKERIDIPYRVVIDEYVEQAKTFGAEQSHKYINGVLDKLATQLRSVEVQARR